MCSAVAVITAHRESSVQFASTIKTEQLLKTEPDVFKASAASYSSRQQTAARAARCHRWYSLPLRGARLSSEKTCAVISLLFFFTFLLVLSLSLPLPPEELVVLFLTLVKSLR